MPSGDSLKFIGCMLLLSGWIIVLASLVMLSTLSQRAAFVAAGIALEVLGLVFLTRSYTAAERGTK